MFLEVVVFNDYFFLEKRSDIINYCAVILAGGNGIRLYPLSRKGKPKQFLKLYNKNSMIIETINRINTIFPKDKIFILTTHQHETLMKKELKNYIDNENIIVEPYQKSTAACIGLAAMIIKKRFENDSVMCVFSADHYIEDIENFKISVQKSIDLAEKSNSLITIGINPTYPSTEFGYIKVGEKLDDKVYNVERFIEKPNYEQAKKFIKDEKYLWNSGMFSWKISIILTSFENFLPDMYKILEKIYKSLDNFDYNKNFNYLYSLIDPISIDYGILEKSKNVEVVYTNLKWMDIGNLNSFFNIRQKDENDNIIIGDSFQYKTTNTSILSTDKLIVTFGIDDLCIVETDDVIFISGKDNIKDIKDLHDEMENSDYSEYL